MSFDLERFIWALDMPFPGGGDDVDWHTREKHLCRKAEELKGNRRFDLWKLRHDQEEAA